MLCKNMAVVNDPCAYFCEGWSESLTSSFFSFTHESSTVLDCS